MRLEHAIDDDGQEQLVLHDAADDEVAALGEVFRTLAEANGRRVAIHGLPFVTRVDECRLQALSGPDDAGVTPKQTPARSSGSCARRRGPRSRSASTRGRRAS